MMTTDEVLKRAFDGRARRRDYLLTYSNKPIHEVEDLSDASFLASLRADGWTLAPVEATPKMIDAALAVAASEAGEPLETFSLKQINATKAKARELWNAMLDAAKEDGDE